MTDPSQTRNPAHWIDLMQRHDVTIWNSVPALLDMLVEYAAGRPNLIPPSLRLVMMSGDWIPVALPDRLRTLAPDVEIVSLGGATEASIWSIAYPIGQVDPEWKSIPYGRPMVNQQFHVLNDALEPCPVWVPGQLFIGGMGLALGYWRDEAKTSASFIVSPLSGERLYRTGDWGRYLPDGNIEFLGREDFQVKIGGHRIELGEIESALSQHPSVRADVVVAAGDPKRNRRLVAYVVPEAAAMPQQGETRPQPDLALQHLDAAKGLLLDPIAREEFKLRQPGLRRDQSPIALIHLDRGALHEEALAAYVQRRSYRTFVDDEIPLAHLSDLMGCLRRIDIEGVPVPKALYGSAGSLYPVQAYLYIKAKRVHGLEGGIYYYHPTDHCLVLLTPGAYIDVDVHAPANRDVFGRSAFSIFLVGRMSAIEPLYGDLGRQLASVEAGLMAQLLEMSAPPHSIGLCQMGGLDFARVRHLFALEDDDVLLHSLVGGGIEPQQKTMTGFRSEAAKTPPSVRSAIPRSPSSEVPLVAELRRFLRTKLPEYMVPSSFVLLEELPLTGNGKADRKVLLARDGSEGASAPYVAPGSALEHTIAGVVQDVLRVERVGVHDNFFELGANSVELVQAHRKLQTVLERDLPIVDMFKYPTVSALAQYLSQSIEDTTVVEDSQARGRSRRETMRHRSQARGRTQSKVED